jgi:AraC-like DNA-binding protein
MHRKIFGGIVEREKRHATWRRSFEATVMAGATKHGHGRPPLEAIPVFKAQSFIQKNYKHDLSLRKVANVADINPNYLSQRFKQVTGMKFVEYIARTRFEKACRLLHDGDLRISDIAFAAGFRSLSQFNRVFKKLCGKSPTQFRAAKHMVRRHR